MEGKRRMIVFSMDRITHLPCNVIDHILSFMPIRDAARTSILARAWRHKWQNIPHLSFDIDLEEYSPEMVIYNVLLLHKGPITKFSVNCPVQNKYVVDQWLRFLSNHPIEHLTLNMATSYLLRQSCYMFNFELLKHLKLVGVVVRFPHCFKGFDKLVTLALIRVKIELEGLKSLISKSPMLELLELCSCYFNQNLLLDIDAPKLKSFLFSGGEFRSISFENARSLEDISIEYHGPTVTWMGLEYENNTIHGFNQSIKKLSLPADSLKFLAVGGVPHELPNSLCRLTFLRLHNTSFVCIDAAVCALCLIRSCPNLKTLVINTIMNNITKAEEKFVVQYLKEQQKCNVPFSSLKCVRIGGLSDCGPELEFVKVLLARATTLDRLEIVSTFTCCRGQTKISMLKELASCRRASPEAEVVFC